MGLVSGLSLAKPSGSESFLVVHALFRQDGCQREGFWEVVGHVVSPFDLSKTLLVDGGLLLPCSLPGPSVVERLMQMLLWCLARVGGFNPCASSNRRNDAEVPILRPPGVKTNSSEKALILGKIEGRRRRGQQRMRRLDGITG